MAHRRKKLSHTSRFYVNLPRGIRKHTDPLVKKSRIGVDPEKGKHQFRQAVKDFIRGLRRK